MSLRELRTLTRWDTINNLLYYLNTVPCCSLKVATILHEPEHFSHRGILVSKIKGKSYSLSNNSVQQYPGQHAGNGHVSHSLGDVVVDLDDANQVVCQSDGAAYWQGVHNGYILVQHPDRQTNTINTTHLQKWDSARHP